MELGLKGKVALVLASSKGLGRASAEALYREGAHVMLSGRQEAGLKQAYDSIRGQEGGQVSYFRADISSLESIRALVAATRHTYGKIDILINNGGGPPAGGFDSFQDEDWQQAFELTLLSYVRTIREVLLDLKERQGRIINLTSSSVKEPIPGLILSNVFRAGVLGLTKTLAHELAGDGVLVHTIGPGKIATDRSADLDRQKAEEEGISLEAFEVRLSRGIPLGRYGTPEEFGKVVAFFASQACSYMTGSAILVDGGRVKAL